MIELGLHNPTEQRAKGFTDLVADALIAAAEGVAQDAGRTAAVEAASGFTARAFAAASVDAAAEWRDVLGASFRADAGRRLIRDGEFVGQVSTNPNGIEATFDYDVAKGGRYRLTFARPETSVTLKEVDPAKVIHARYSADKHQPWIGRSPMAWARSTSELAGNLEQVLADEAGAPHGYILPLAQETGKRQDGVSLEASMTAKLRELRGRLLVQPVRTTSTRSIEDVHAVQKWAAARVGVNPPESIVALARQTFEHTLAAYGLSAALVLPGNQVGQREALRNALHTVVEPIARILEEALTRTLETPVRFDFAPLAGIDVQSRARAVKALVDAGVTLEDALAKVVW